MAWDTRDRYLATTLSLVASLKVAIEAMLPTRFACYKLSAVPLHYNACVLFSVAIRSDQVSEAGLYGRLIRAV